MYVGMPAAMYLHEFGSQVYFVFNDFPHLVGSALTTKQWRDIDVRLILFDDEYAKWGLGDPKYPQHNGKWVSLCKAYSALAKHMTGLPVDFQIQQMTLANKEFAKQPRSALGFVPLRMIAEERASK